MFSIVKLLNCKFQVQIYIILVLPSSAVLKPAQAGLVINQSKKIVIIVTNFFVDGIFKQNNIWTSASNNLALNITGNQLRNKKCKIGSILTWNSNKVSLLNPFGSFDCQKDGKSHFALCIATSNYHREAILNRAYAYTWGLCHKFSGNSSGK